MISLQDVSKQYPSASLNNVDLHIHEGEFVALIGKSGCGKSTLLKMAGGLLSPTQGTVERKGKVSFMFQQALLLPWKSVYENVVLPKKLGRDVVHPEKNLEKVGLAHVKNSLPHELSLGMQQRVALARTFSADAPVLLMDEPFSALDEITREEMQQLLLHLWGEEKRTVLFVTHSIEEAVRLADRVLVLSPEGIKKEQPIPLPRPRTREMVHSHVQALAAAL